ncbi:MAG TPA: hypothetical protein VGH47_15945 [Xanthobacteraceae bacterium]
MTKLSTAIALVALAICLLWAWPLPEPCARTARSSLMCSFSECWRSCENAPRQSGMPLPDWPQLPSWPKPVQR